MKSETKGVEILAMNMEIIKERLKSIDRIKGDDEGAHSAQDQLFVDFIKYVSKCSDAHSRLLAKEVLKACDIDFER